MKIWNLIACICACESLCHANCYWYHLSACAMGVKQLNKSGGVRLILLILCICPIICLTGIIHWIVGVPKSIDQVVAFVDAGDVEGGFNKIIIPEKHNMVVDKANELIDKIFTCGGKVGPG